MNILIQGGLYGDFTLATAYEYAKIDFITKVIISTWEGEKIFQNDIKSDKIVVLKSEMPENNGPGNMNLQIISSREGIKICDNGLIMKTRSDQHLYEASLHKWMKHFSERQFGDTLRYTDGEKQRSKIFLIGNNKRFPFHPQDHFFLGYKQDLERLFGIPLWDAPAWTWRDAPIKFTERLRPNIYLGINYYKQFYPEVERFLLNEGEYLLDDSPKYEEAMDFYSPRRDSIFLPLPRIEMWWAKQNSGYWYCYEKEGEYYAD
jgi:hypothetical protein